MLVPEATMNEDDLVVASENYIWLSGQTLYVKPESIA